jgi:hypothetical protein
MNTNDYTPRFKTPKKKTGYHNDVPIRIPLKKRVSNATKPPTDKVAKVDKVDKVDKVSIKKSIKNSISSAIEYIKNLKHKSKKSNVVDLQPSITTTFEENKLEILENEMINMVDNVKDVENETIEQDNIVIKFGDIIKNLTIELHHVIGYAEQNNMIEQIKKDEKSKSPEKYKVNEQEQPAEKIDHVEKNFNELNSILNLLAENILDAKKKKRELSFSESTIQNTKTYTIRVISLGIAISYTNLEEFIDKIANRAGTVKSLCWFAGCPDQFNIELKKFIELNNATKKDYNKIFKILKNMIDAYLSKNDPDTYSKIEHLVNLTSGGKKRKPKKVTKPRKPKKVTKV